MRLTRWQPAPCSVDCIMSTSSRPLDHFFAGHRTCSTSPRAWFGKSFAPCEKVRTLRVKICWDRRFRVVDVGRLPPVYCGVRPVDAARPFESERTTPIPRIVDRKRQR